MTKSKPIHVKPAFYSFCYEQMKDVASKYGYNLLIHGSMNRDCDLVAVAWVNEIGVVDDMVSEIAEVLGGEVMQQTEESLNCFPHGRLGYVVEMNRGGYWNNFDDKQYYFDISVMPPYRRANQFATSSCKSAVGKLKTDEPDNLSTK